MVALVVVLVLVLALLEVEDPARLQCLYHWRRWEFSRNSRFIIYLHITKRCGVVVVVVLVLDSLWLSYIKGMSKHFV